MRYAVNLLTMSIFNFYGEDGMNSNRFNGNQLRIAHFTWEFPPAIWGGLGTFATELTQKQVSMGHEVTVFAVNTENRLIPEENWHGVKVFRPKTLDLTPGLILFSNNDLKSWGEHFPFFSQVIGYNVMSVSTLVHNLVEERGENYDIIDAHDWLGIIGGMIAKRELDLPLIFHIHSTEYGRSGGSGGSPTINYIERKGGEAADGIITVSYAMKEELQRLGFPKEKIRVCWNGIDPYKYNPDVIPLEQRMLLRKQYGIKENEIFLFFIGRLVAVKGCEQLIHAMPHIVREHPNVKLVMLGVGDLEHSIRVLIDKYNLHHHVTLRTEFVPEQERILHYAAADIVVLPSLYEPFGIVCTEAMAMAKPVVVGAQGTSGLREQVIPNGDKQCGIHINPYDPEDIAWGVTQLLDSEEKRIWMGRNGRQRVFEEFTWDAVAEDTLAVYSEFLH